MTAHPSFGARHSAAPHLKRGATLPYRLLGAVEPCPDGWLVVSGKLQGISLFPEPPQVMGKLVEVLDYRPAFEVVALHAPIGLPGEAVPGGRACDREARRLLGPRRGAAVVSPPARAVLDDEARLSAVARRLLPRMREVQRDVASYHQRSIFEVHPELSFYQLNEDQPLRYPKRTRLGTEERLAILTRRMPGVERVLDHVPAGVPFSTVLDACAGLWTARRIAARAVSRIPDVPEWNEDGLRMELVR